MAGYLLRRLAASLLLFFTVLTVTFFLVHLAPGSPANVLADPRVPAGQRARLERIYGLDRPLAEQYGRWLAAVALRGDWGISFVHSRPVVRVLAEAFPATLLLAASALAVEYATALLLGLLAARRSGGLADHLVRILSLTLYSMPVFWLGVMAILLFAYLWPVLPAGGMRAVGAEDLGSWARAADLLRHLLLPALVLGLWNAGGTTRIVRAGLLETLGQDYIRAARAKGLTERRVLWVHGLRNALVPLTQLFALTLPLLLNGSLVTEVVFAWPGLGRLVWLSFLTRDYPVILGATALSASLVIAGNLFGDLLLALVDPRVRDA